MLAPVVVQRSIFTGYTRRLSVFEKLSVYSLIDKYANVTADNYDVAFAKNNLKQENALRKKIGKIKGVTALTKRDEALIHQAVNGELI